MRCLLFLCRGIEVCCFYVEVMRGLLFWGLGNERFVVFMSMY